MRTSSKRRRPSPKRMRRWRQRITKSRSTRPAKRSNEGSASTGNGLAESSIRARPSAGSPKASGRPGGDRGGPRESGRLLGVRGSRHRDRPREESVEAKREDPPGALVFRVLEGAVADPRGQEPEPRRRAGRGPPLSGSDGDGEQRLPERARFHERSARDDHGRPDVRRGQRG